jgi:Spy/CpxP family protein refolding chaperone
MQKLNVLVLASLSLALAAPLVPAFAQAPPPPMHGPMGGPMHGGYGGGGGRMNRMGDALGLTDAQKSKMMPIIMATRPQMEAIRNNPKLTPAARLAKMEALRKSTNMKMMAILTPAQRVKVKAMQQGRPGARKGG